MTVPSIDDQEQSPTEQRALSAKLPPHWALGPAHLAFVAFFTFLFVLYCNLPLRGTDLWGHAMFGGWIIDHRALPDEDPFLPLARGMEVVDFSWLAQVIFAAIDRSMGPVGLSILFAVVMVASGLIQARTFYIQSRSAWIMLLTVIAALGLAWSRLWTLRPEVFGTLLFALLLYLLTASESAGTAYSAASQPRATGWWRLWLAVPVIFVLWANLHGSFLCGLGLVGLWTIGETVDVAWQKKSLRAALADGHVQQLAFLSELAFLATLVNPYGLDLHITCLRFGANENLRLIVEWLPVTITGLGGIEFALSWVLLLFVWRHSRLRVTFKQVLLLFAFALLAMQRVRMMGWYANVYGWILAPHLADIAQRYFGRAQTAPGPVGANGLPPGRSFHYTLACGLLLWLGFVFSPLGALILDQKSPDTAGVYETKSSPPGITDYLKKNPPVGQTFQPQHWGDWLVRNVPGFRPFATTNIHLIPQRVWEDYLKIGMASSGWQAATDRYNITTLILDKENQPPIVAEMRHAPGWELLYEDDQGVVYGRTPPKRSTTTNLSSERGPASGQQNSTSTNAPEAP